MFVNIVTIETIDGYRIIDLDKIKDINSTDNFVRMKSGIIYHLKKSEIRRLIKLADEYIKTFQKR